MTSLQGGRVTSVDLGVVRQGARRLEQELNEVARVFSG